MWRETKMSARPLLAIAVRSSSGMKTSSSRVIRTSNSPARDSFSRIFRPIASTTSFSFSPVGPIAPGSFPPWPGSIITRTRCFRAVGGGGRTEGRGRWGGGGSHRRRHRVLRRRTRGDGTGGNGGIGRRRESGDLPFPVDVHNNPERAGKREDAVGALPLEVDHHAHRVAVEPPRPDLPEQAVADLDRLAEDLVPDAGPADVDEDPGRKAA